MDCVAWVVFIYWGVKVDNDGVATPDHRLDVSLDVCDALPVVVVRSLLQNVHQAVIADDVHSSTLLMRQVRYSYATFPVIWIKIQFLIVNSSVVPNDSHILEIYTPRVFDRLPASAAISGARCHFLDF